MPMNCPTLDSLRKSFDGEHGVPYREGETEAEYRERCAVWSETHWNDHVQAQEIRTGKGWDRWSGEEMKGLLRQRRVQSVIPPPERPVAIRAAAYSALQAESDRAEVLEGERDAWRDRAERAEAEVARLQRVVTANVRAGVVK